MSYVVDLKYLQLISPRLDRFRKKSTSLFICRCPLCGDSATNKFKRRGYFYKREDKLMYTCHNCGESMTFSYFLYQLDKNISKEYKAEIFMEKRAFQEKKESDLEIYMQFHKEPVFKEKSELEKVCTRLSKCPPDNAARVYAESRQIPKKHFDELFYIDDIANVAKLFDRYEGQLHHHEERLVIPSYDARGNLVGLSCRALHGETPKYQAFRVDDETSLSYGYNLLDDTKQFFVMEGQIDSMFVDNSAALMGLNFNKIKNVPFNKENMVVVLDNQPRNKDVCRTMEKIIDVGFAVVVWEPNTDEEGKDINELYLAGVDVSALLKSRVFKGMRAKLEFSKWKRV